MLYDACGHNAWRQRGRVVTSLLVNSLPVRKTMQSTHPRTTTRVRTKVTLAHLCIAHARAEQKSQLLLVVKPSIVVGAGVPAPADGRGCASACGGVRPR